MVILRFIPDVSVALPMVTALLSFTFLWLAGYFLASSSHISMPMTGSAISGSIMRMRAA
jgi:hypothetical protein